MTREKALILARQNGAQFNLSNTQNFIAMFFVYTMMFHEMNGLITAFIFILIMSYGIWDVNYKLIGKKATIQHFTFRLITTIVIWFLSLSSISLIRFLKL